jgi:hypothetical protein
MAVNQNGQGSPCSAQLLTSGLPWVLPFKNDSEVVCRTHLIRWASRIRYASRNRQSDRATPPDSIASPCIALCLDSQDGLHRRSHRPCTTHTAESRPPREGRNTEAQRRVGAILESHLSGRSTPCCISWRRHAAEAPRRTTVLSCVLDCRHNGCARRPLPHPRLPVPAG